MRAARAASRLFHTVRHLRAAQLAWLLRDRLLPRHRAPAAPRDLHLRALALGPGVPPRDAGAGRELRFLNVARRFEAAPDWRAADLPKLWRYHLHYFDYALEPRRSREEIGALIESWIDANPPGTADAWEPYPASLRIVNWIKYFSRTPRAVPEHWRRSLWQQAAWLARNQERHLLANHYLKNVKALVFAGAYFDDAAARRWLADGTRVFAAQAAEQFLADGGHYERSPMYHALCTEDLLDVLGLAQQTPALFPAGFAEGLRARGAAALRWLDAMCMPDGEITLFNDAALGIAPTLAELRGYAARLGLATADGEAAGSAAAVSLAASGYYVIASGRDKLVADCGAIGPDHQPGHAHCDTLSYELALAGRRVVVDSGVHDYEPSAHRRYARSTAAHNTVVVDGEEQSEVWAAFRVARRARPLSARLARRGERGFEFEGAHDGYARLPGRVLHKRSIEHDGAARWHVRDELTGRGRHGAESRIHLHPDCRARAHAGGFVVTGDGGTPVARVELAGDARVRVDSGWHFPEFGRALRNDVIVVSASGELPLRLGYTIVKTAQ